MCYYQSAACDRITFCSHGLNKLWPCTTEKKAKRLSFSLPLSFNYIRWVNWILWASSLKGAIWTGWDLWHSPCSDILWSVNQATLFFLHSISADTSPVLTICTKYFSSIYHDIYHSSLTRSIIYNKMIFSIPFIRMRRLILISPDYGIKRNNPCDSA